MNTFETWLKEQLIIYLRKSQSDDPNESVEEVLARHERILQDHAVKIIGAPIPEENIYREVVSGETIEARPEIKKVLSRIEDSNIKAVMVVEPSRLSRGDWEDGGKILSAFKYSKTLVVTPQKTYDLQDKFDYKYFKMDLSQAHEYLEYVKEILNRGRVQSAREGNFVGSTPPYGYSKIFVDKDPILVPNEHEAKAVNLALEWYVREGIGWQKICERLENMGFYPRKGKHWLQTTIKDIVFNPANIGYIRWNHTKVIEKYENGKLVKRRPRRQQNDDEILVKGKHEPIITDMELYAAGLEKLKQAKPKVVRDAVLVNPLAGLLYCRNCGTAMNYREYRRKGELMSAPRYLCNHQKHCKTKSAFASDVYEGIIKALENLIEDFSIKLTEAPDQSRNIQLEVIKTIKDKIQKLDERQNELYDLLEDKVYTREVFLKRSEKLRIERDDLVMNLKYIEENLPEPVDYQEKIRTFTDVITGLRDPEVSVEEKNKLLKSIIKRINYHRDSSIRHKWDTSKPEIEIELIDF